jgi:hypothetical protein
VLVARSCFEDGQEDARCHNNTEAYTINIHDTYHIRHHITYAVSVNVINLATPQATKHSDEMCCTVEEMQAEIASAAELTTEEILVTALKIFKSFLFLRK